MRLRISAAIGISALLLASCGQPSKDAQAMATFAAFQDALFAADKQALRNLVTEESAAAVDAMPFDSIRQQQRLVATEAQDLRGSWLVRAENPNQRATSGDYIVTRERGRFVVDLVATAQLHATSTGIAAPSGFTQRELTPADHDEIRRRALATPPAAPGR
jgi:hypothetical protein